MATLTAFRPLPNEATFQQTIKQEILDQSGHLIKDKERLNVKLKNANLETLQHVKNLLTHQNSDDFFKKQQKIDGSTNDNPTKDYKVATILVMQEFKPDPYFS